MLCACPFYTYEKYGGSIVLCLLFVLLKQYFRDPRCLTDLVRCCVILDSIQVSSSLPFPLVFFSHPSNLFDKSISLVFVCLFMLLHVCVHQGEFALLDGENGRMSANALKNYFRWLQ
jgi:hypothetical protein